ncbi:MAG: hypothetical protein ABF483_04035 [Liquorilactobacillus nagelii]|jgi:cell division protein FtsL|uniref:Uncharacterized protein n=1 Tax=Liquorilactobacillus nagelii TaxID=82688 RepID=A0A3Q8D164_9LACO|nr:hypothetical protein [Liquorilactobacillus nagelii]AUJ32971.1 hypothetical protein BSQ50_10725 [Liquorilactobacillus nagelii]KRL42152.1 hypothetical protein FD45_GL000389 [Liquorilactobacillus nagelii DSM 13675]MCC7616576.1 hypothetical protein [Liquorilactobacillus nagelii]MCI1633891.1 hypothetical protein [Liquorilactobacillus nagelii]MCI1700472.1 hypothetical protein [Liquorilactobacillus nagelii]
MKKNEDSDLFEKDITKRLKKVQAPKQQKEKPISKLQVIALIVTVIIVAGIIISLLQTILSK